MSAAPNRRRSRSKKVEHENNDRWLLTYSDMITLLMALFIIMWAVSSVNSGKFNELKVSLSNAFSGGKVLSANDSILSGQPSPFAQDSPSPIVPITPREAIASRFGQTMSEMQHRANQADVENLRRIKRKLDAAAGRLGLSGRLFTSIDERGLVIRLLTDDLLFASGSAVLSTNSYPILDTVTRLISDQKIANPVQVAGNTDSVPISTAQFPSNWELSAARASAVL